MELGVTFREFQRHAKCFVPRYFLSRFALRFRRCMALPLTLFLTSFRILKKLSVLWDIYFCDPRDACGATLQSFRHSLGWQWLSLGWQWLHPTLPLPCSAREPRLHAPCARASFGRSIAINSIFPSLWICFQPRSTWALGTLVRGQPRPEALLSRSKSLICTSKHRVFKLGSNLCGRRHRRLGFECPWLIVDLQVVVVVSLALPWP